MTTPLLLAAISTAILLQLALGIGAAFWRLRRRDTVPLPVRSGHASTTATGAWAGWRDFRVEDDVFEDEGRTRRSLILTPVDGQPPPDFAPGQFHHGLTAQNCMARHTDHTNSALTSGTRAAFSHALLDPALRENCTSRHTAPKTAVHSAPTAQCTQRHSQNGWKPATFDHARFFVLDKDHNAACTTCHTMSDQRQYTCYSCHEHAEAKIRAKHIREGIRNFTNCVSCHRTAHGEAREGGKREGGDKRKRDHG